MPDSTEAPSLEIRRACRIMDEFARSTGLDSDAPPRRYLWTDAFAVCNYLGLHRATGDQEHLDRAVALVDQVHRVLGRHRPDDSRTGWISGLSEEEGRRHPTAGGLRIGKPRPERRPDEPYDSQAEWDRDGQYFHYLTRWMHALGAVTRETGDRTFHRWAVELARAAHAAFVYELPGGRKRMYWKMSIDLSRPLVPSMGAHDPLDGLVTLAELAATAGGQGDGGRDAGQGDAGREERRDDATADGGKGQDGTRGRDEPVELSRAIAELATMLADVRWATEDALGIGGLLVDGWVMARLLELGRFPVLPAPVEPAGLLTTLLGQIVQSLHAFDRMRLIDLPPAYRLPFRELGLAIGLQAGDRMLRQAPATGVPEAAIRPFREDLTSHIPLAGRIVDTWLDPAAHGTTWHDHEDINAVMLATALAPDGYLDI